MYENWVVPAGVGPALADILGAERGEIIDFVLERGGRGVNVIKSFFFWGGGSRRFESHGGAPGSASFHHHHHRLGKMYHRMPFSVIDVGRG